jgi:apolipoprotein N-acyltransferase
MNRKIILAVAAIAASGTMFFFGTGLHPLWWLMWLAPLPVLLVAPRVSGLAGFGVATLSWFLGTLNMWRYLRHILVLPGNPHAGPLVMPIAVAIGVLVIPSCIFGATVVLARLFMRRGQLWPAALALPTLWTTYEYVNNITSPHGTFGSVAYSQMDFLPLLQLASVAGIWGIIFCLFFFPATIAVFVGATATQAQKRTFATAISVLFVAVMMFGWLRLYLTPETEHSVKVGLIASDLRDNLVIEEPEENGRLLRDYLTEAKPMIAQGASVIVMPEKLSVVVDALLEPIDAMFKAAAVADNVRFLAGVLHVTGGAKLNEARMYFPDNAQVITYEKHHMLPAFESKLRPGTTRTLVSQTSGLWGVAICKDMDFPLLSRQYSRDGVGLLLVSAWDFADDAWLHGRMAVARGVESGFSIARAAKEGLLTVTDDRGRVLAERSSKSAPFTTLVADVPIRHTTTIYARLGDWFAWLNILMLLSLTISLCAKHRQRGGP